MREERDLQSLTHRFYYPNCLGGLVVPAMSKGSSGMERGNRKDHYDVLLVNRDGTTQTYARY